MYSLFMMRTVVLHCNKNLYEGYGLVGFAQITKFFYSKYFSRFCWLSKVKQNISKMHNEGSKLSTISTWRSKECLHIYRVTFSEMMWKQKRFTGNSRAFE